MADFVVFDSFTGGSIRIWARKWRIASAWILFLADWSPDRFEGMTDAGVSSVCFFESVFSIFEGVRSKYMRFWYKIRIENNCSSSGILQRYLSTGKGIFGGFSEMLVSLRCWKKQSRLGFEIFKCGRQGYFFIESRRTASQTIWLEGSKHSPKNLTFHTKYTTLAANTRQK